MVDGLVEFVVLVLVDGFFDVLVNNVGVVML